MRERWPRFRPEIKLDVARVTGLLRHVFPAAEAVASERVGGGLANTNLKVTLARPVATEGGHAASLLLRLYQRDPAQASKERDLDLRLRAVGVPTARFHGLIEADQAEGLTAAVLDWVEGDRLDRLVPGPDETALGRAVGAMLARVHAIDVGPAGFLRPDRRPAAAIALGRAPMEAYLTQCLREGPGGGRLGEALTRRLFETVTREADRLAAWPPGPGLVHGDCNASNILLREGQVVALLDWEFAFSGASAFDFGHLMRPPLGDSRGFAEGLAAGTRAAGRSLPADWLALARLADLYAWADFLGRPALAPEIIADARRMVARTLSM